MNTIRGLPEFVRKRLMAGPRLVVCIGESLGERIGAFQVEPGNDDSHRPVTTSMPRYCHALTVHDAARQHAAAMEQALGPVAALMSLSDEVAADEVAGRQNTDLVLGEACRHFPAGLFVELRHESESPEVAMQAATRLFAFGLRRVGSLQVSSRRYSWYEYSLKDYKPAPDWLNARFWANPERFDVHDEES